MLDPIFFDFPNRNALVTGGSSGIGRAAVHVLAAGGARVAVLGKNLESVQETVATLEGGAGRHLPLAADVSDATGMERAFATVASSWHHLDILVINAGINGVWCPLGELEPEEWDRTLAVNLRGTFLTLKYALPLLRVRGGSVIIVSSINGNRVFSLYGATAYACSKAAQVAFAKMAALELAPDHIRVNVICPGSVSTNIDQSTTMRNLDRIQLPDKTGFVPLTDGAAGTPTQTAHLIAFLASDASRHITGTEVYLDGAQSLLAN